MLSERIVFVKLQSLESYVDNTSYKLPIHVISLSYLFVGWNIRFENKTCEKSGSFTLYRQTSSISSTISKNLNVSRLVLQLSLPISLKPGVKSTGDAPTTSDWSTTLLPTKDAPLY